MKIKLSLLLALVLGAGSASLTAQDAAAAKPAVSETVTNGPGDEIQDMIAVADTPLPDAIKTLARQANINIQFDSRLFGGTNAQPSVSFRWEKVSAKQALAALLDNNNLQLSEDTKTRISTVKTKDPAALEPLVTRVYQLQNASPTNIVLLLQPMLSARSKVVADPRTGQLVVLATDKEMESVQPFLKQLDTPTKQVLIEANLIETSQNPTTAKGINWAGTLEQQNVSFGNNLRVTPINESVNNLLAQNRVVAGAGMASHLGYINADGITAVLSFINKNTESEVVATPRTVTLDNQKARLEVTKAFPIFKITPGTAQTPAGVEITYTNVGTILEVTPRVSANDFVSLTVQPEVSNIEAVDTKTVNGTINQANIYAIRKMSTQVMLPSGTTLVMGGLISDTYAASRTKVPGLGDVPVLGNAFRSNTRDKKKANLMIFVTPTIVEESDFQTSSTDFLQSKMNKGSQQKPWTEWNNVEPKDWTKPVE